MRGRREKGRKGKVKGSKAEKGEDGKGKGGKAKKEGKKEGVTTVEFETTPLARRGPEPRALDRSATSSLDEDNSGN